MHLKHKSSHIIDEEGVGVGDGVGIGVGEGTVLGVEGEPWSGEEGVLPPPPPHATIKRKIKYITTCLIRGRILLRL